MTTQVTGTVRVEALAEALQKVIPFMAGEKTDRDILKHVYFEAHNDAIADLELTAADGFRLAHVLVEADWPTGTWVLDGPACKVLAHTTERGEVEVVADEEKVMVGGHTLPVRGLRWVNYHQIHDDTAANMAAEVVLARKELARLLKGPEANIAGLMVGPDGCRLFLAHQDRKTLGVETISCRQVPVQVVAGDARTAFPLDRLAKALRSCDESVTIKLQGEGKSALLESGRLWAVLVPQNGFPRKSP